MPRDKTGHFYFPWYPTIYQQDTQHLSLIEDGAYRRLLDHYMLTRAPLPGDDRALARIVGIGFDEWMQIKTQVVSFFKPTGFSYTHTFCDEVLAADSARIIRARKNGKKGGRPTVRETTEITQPVPETNPVGSPNTTQHLPEQIVDDVTGGSGDPIDGFYRTPFQIIHDAGSDLFPNLLTQNTDPIRKWVEAGCDPSLDVIPILQRTAAKGIRVQSWRYFSQAIMDAKATRETPLPKGIPHANTHRTAQRTKDDRSKDAVVEGLLEYRSSNP